MYVNILCLNYRVNRIAYASIETICVCKSQAQTLEVLITKEWFTEEELDIVRRGRNAKSYTKAKNTDVQTYRKSSGLEAVIGFLYLDHQNERLDALLDTIVQIVDER